MRTIRDALTEANLAHKKRAEYLERKLRRYHILLEKESHYLEHFNPEKLSEIREELQELKELFHKEDNYASQT
jgi:hypothetical protein